MREFAKKTLGDEKGLAIVEFALMLPLVVIIMMFLIIIYDFNRQQVAVQEKLRFEMRKSMDDNAQGPFSPNQKTESLFVDIPGRMKNVLGRPFIRQSMTIHFYEGCYQGLNQNQYRMRYLYREVKP